MQLGGKIQADTPGQAAAPRYAGNAGRLMGVLSAST